MPVDFFRSQAIGFCDISSCCIIIDYDKSKCDKTGALGLGEISRADLNFTIKTCTVGIG